MRTSRRVTRRSFLSSVTAGITAGSATLFVTGPARAQGRTYTGVTDSDTGTNADAPGYGRGTRNQYTDQDTGPNADAQFHGRGPAAQREGGPSGNGNYGAATNCTDTDRGSQADPAGRGRCGQPRNRTPTSTRHCSDSDTGANYDESGYGRHC